jgi:molybdopterin synthase catalytic subunit
MSVRVQTEDFDVGRELDSLVAGGRQAGAVVSFTGLVREASDSRNITAMTLEHYTGMTERALQDIIERARERWDIFDALVIHRVGRLLPGDRIVLVAVSGSHRGECFRACEFIMDYLKTEAPFWKKEETAEAGAHWVEARQTDDEAAQRWVD